VSAKKAEENLRPFDKLSEEEQREIRSKGGKASGETRRQRKTFKEVFSALLPMDINPDKAISGLSQIIKEENPQLTAEQAIAMAQIYKAINGDTQAAIFVRDTVGDKPKEQIEQTINGFDKYFKNDE